jgi:hypothetical protein
MTIMSITLPDDLYKRLQRQAAAEDRSVDELIESTLIRQLPADVSVEEDLPLLIKEELQAMAYLSNSALWAIARSTQDDEQEQEFDALHDAAEERDLAIDELKRRDELLREYGEHMLRRAHAAVLLQSRGFDMSDPAVLNQ